mgnify:CR=1 FL=1
MARSKHARLKVGGTKFNQHLETALDANAQATDAVNELLDAWQADELTPELLTGLLALAAAAVATTATSLHECYAIVQEGKT